jgi:hypothetical protein
MNGQSKLAENIRMPLGLQRATAFRDFIGFRNSTKLGDVISRKLASWLGAFVSNPRAIRSVKSADCVEVQARLRSGWKRLSN